MGKSLKVNALIDVLNLYRPDQLDELRRRHPDQIDLLAPGQMLGEVSVRATAAAELAVLSLKAIKDRIKVNLKWLRRRLKQAMRIRLMSNIVSAVTSAGLISSVLLQSKWAAITTALINLISSISLIISQYLESPFLGKQSNSQDLFDQLVQAAVDIEELEFKLTIGIKNQASEEELLELAQKANSVVASVRRVEVTIGISVI
jgi:hypothetical protein